MPVWYPSFIANLEIRFDEAFNVVEDQSPAPESPTSLETGQKIPGPPLVRPLASYGAKDNLTQVGARIPKSATVELNGLRQAHTFNMAFDFRDFPIDPRLIRDARLEIFLGVVSPENFARGMTRVEQDGSRASMISTDTSSTNSTNLLFYGLLDESSVEHTERGSFVHMTGRDIRGVLMDAKADPRLFRDLDLSQPIDGVVLQIISRLPFASGVNVYVQAEEWPNQTVPSPMTKDGVTRVRLGADGKQKPLSSPMGEGDKIGFWDLITKYCTLVGAIPFFIGKDLRIRPAKSLYQQLYWDATQKTPFLGGLPRLLKLDSRTERINIRRFVYGRDLLTVKFDRKHRGQKVPMIKVVSIDTSSKKRGLQKMLIAFAPSKSAQAKSANAVDKAKKTSVAPSGQISQTDVLTFSLPGIRDQAVLQAAADNLYQEIGRNELGGSAATKEFASFNTDDGEDPDLLTLIPGDAVQLVTDKRQLSSSMPQVSELITQTRLSFSEAVDLFTKRLGDRNLARALVATARNAVVELQDTFRTKNVKYSMAEGGAMSIGFDFENFIEIRADVNKPPPQTTGKPKGRSAA